MNAGLRGSCRSVHLQGERVEVPTTLFGDSSAVGQMHSCSQPRPARQDVILLHVATRAASHRRCGVRPETTPVVAASLLPTSSQSPRGPYAPNLEAVLAPV